MIEGNRKYIPCLYILNKIDDITMEELEILDQIPHYVPISAHLNWGLDDLIDSMWDYLDLIRVYTKPKGQEPGTKIKLGLSTFVYFAFIFCENPRVNV